MRPNTDDIRFWLVLFASFVLLLVFMLAYANMRDARAQDQPGPVVMPQSPLDQALSEKLLNEVYMGVQCRQNAIGLQTALQQAQLQIEALRKKLEELKKP